MSDIPNDNLKYFQQTDCMMAFDREDNNLICPQKFKEMGITPF